MRLSLTGYSGFIGSGFLKKFGSTHHINCVGRTSGQSRETMFDISNGDEVLKAFENTDVVIHCAGCTHVPGKNPSLAWKDLYSSNVELSIRLATIAVAAKVKRFIFISSLKVNGESTRDTPFFYDDVHNPMDDYGKSKSMAEVAVKDILEASDVELVIIRPPLVYGSGVAANFGALFRLVAKGVPLPFGKIQGNQRSLVSLDNLLDLVETCTNHSKAAGQVFLVSDGHDLSTNEIVEVMARVIGVKCVKVPVPVWVLRVVGLLTGRSETIRRLTDSLQVDISRTKEVLGWEPRMTIEEGFKKCIKENCD